MILVEASGTLSHHPIFKKALEIFKVSRAIACSVSDNSNVLQLEYSTNIKHRFAGDLISHSLKLAPELAVLQNSACKTARLKGARRIRKASRNLLVKCQKLELQGVKEKEFLQLLKMEILQFEQLFSEWFYNLQLKKDS